MSNKLILIDGSSVLSKNYYGTLPFEYKMAKTPEDREKALEKVMKTKDGQFTNAVYGMMKFILRLIKEQKITHLVIAWDVSRNTFRREMYADYKGQRGDTPSPLKSQFALAQKFFEKCGFYQGVLAGVEADDIVGTFAKKFENEISTYIITGDQDSLQLITNNTSVWLTTSKSKDLYEKRNINPKDIDVPIGCFEFTPQTFEEEYGITPIQIIDLKAIEGDTSDNIPGVKGVGSESVTKLLQEYGTVEGLYDAIEGLSKEEEDELKEFLKNDLGIKRSPLPYLLKPNNETIVSLLEKEMKNGIDKKSKKRIVDLLKKVDIKNKVEDKTFKDNLKVVSKLDIEEFEPAFLSILSELKTFKNELVGKEAAFVSKTLATIKTDIDEYDQVILEETKIVYDKDRIRKAVEELEFKSLVDKI